RDFHVTGVQTCALPIYRVPFEGVGQIPRVREDRQVLRQPVLGADVERRAGQRVAGRVVRPRVVVRLAATGVVPVEAHAHAAAIEIGRASGRERVWSAGG